MSDSVSLLGAAVAPYKHLHCLVAVLPGNAPAHLLSADEQMQECAVDLLSKVAAAAGGAHPGWCEECALPRVLKLAMHRDYNIRVVGEGVVLCAVLCCAVPCCDVLWRAGLACGAMPSLAG